MYWRNDGNEMYKKDVMQVQNLFFRLLNPANRPLNSLYVLFPIQVMW